MCAPIASERERGAEEMVMVGEVGGGGGGEDADWTVRRIQEQDRGYLVSGRGGGYGSVGGLMFDHELDGLFSPLGIHPLVVVGSVTSPNAGFFEMFYFFAISGF